jgi:peptidoglycan/LPS O-acetylase OafA/YrhL
MVRSGGIFAMMMDGDDAGSSREVSLRTAKVPQGKTIAPLTTLRFFAALFIVFYHSAESFLPIFSARTLSGVPRDLVSRVLLLFPSSVSFFFLLSGYVLSVVYLREGQAVDLRRFSAARFARLYPLYLVVMTLSVPELLLPEVRHYGTAIGLAKTAKIFAANMVMAQAWLPKRLLRIDSPSWSLCVEAFLYVCFPVLGVLLWKLRGVRLWVTALALYVGGQALVWGLRPHLSRQMILFLPPLHLSTFALGILLARWQALQRERNGRRPIQLWQVSMTLGLSTGGMVLSVLLLPLFPVVALYNDGLLAPVFAGFIWALSAMTTRLSLWLSGSWLVALGNASYALYLIHFPLLLLFLNFHWVSPVLYVLYLAVCVGLSLLSFYCFETPVRQWLLQRFHTRSLETMEVASIAQ